MMSEEKKEVVVREVREVTGLSANDPNACWLDMGRFDQVQRIAQIFSQSELVPEQYRGKPANCIIAVQLAIRMGVDPFMLMQKSYIVKGRPGIEAQLKIAVCNQRGPFTGPIQWRFEGERMTPEWTCTAYATDRRTGELCEMALTWATVKSMGWLEPRGERRIPSLWLSMPDQFFRYRSASWFINAFCPEVTLGLPSKEELEDTNIIDVPSSPAIPAPVEADPAKFTAQPVAEQPKRGRPPKAQNVQPEQKTPPPVAQEPAQEARHRQITLLLGEPPAPADDEELCAAGLVPSVGHTVWTGNDSSDARDLAVQLFAEVREHA